MRKSTVYLCAVSVLAVSLASIFAHAHFRQTAGMRTMDDMARMVRNLGLTDLCLFTEASYTRHITQTDLRTPFQELPMSLEHFPSGSLMMPPQELTRNNGKNN
ncbi:MAG: hypothetical protein EG824_04855 [Deltaproteobacteria bacterium]|nr:hypothetical protein [Deltaproteobacteria bacterium]